MTAFNTEADLCSAFARSAPSAWTVYNETAGFDMVLVHDTGFQIAVEAKLRLNARVIRQVVDTTINRGIGRGPDARAVLVPAGGNDDLAALCKLLGVTVVVLGKKWGQSKDYVIRPPLPAASNICQNGGINTVLERFWNNDQWFGQCPVERLRLPEYIPDVPAGTPCPVVLGPWKIQAIKVCIWVNMFGAITRKHFKALGIDPGRWMTGYWLKKGAVRGEWVEGPDFPLQSFKTTHPTIVEAVSNDFHIWSVKNGLDALPPVVGTKAPEQEPML